MEQLYRLIARATQSPVEGIKKDLPGIVEEERSKGSKSVAIEIGQYKFSVDLNTGKMLFNSVEDSEAMDQGARDVVTQIVMGGSKQRE